MYTLIPHFMYTMYAYASNGTPSYTHIVPAWYEEFIP